MKKLSLALLGLLAMAGSETADCKNLSGQYWFDLSEERHPFTTGSFDIPTDGLTDGYHTLHAFVEDENGVSSVSSAWFTKNVSLVPGQQFTATVFVDGSPRNNVSAPVGPDGNIMLEIDMSTLPLGIHTLGTQLITPSGSVTEFREAMFLRVPTTSELTSMRGYYTIDDVIMGSVDARMGQNTYSLDIDASTLSSGIHSISVFLASKYGISTTPFKAWFIKIPQGGEGVKSYRYWLNENEDEAVTINLDKVENPFRLIKLLEVKEQPFVSSRHTFAIEDGEPVVMARNTFHFTTFDADGRMTVGQEDYTDVRVKRSVSNPEELTTGTTDVANPGENGMKWYKFEAEAGDSISLHLDRIGMFEVYAPDASLVVSGSGADALSARGGGLTLNGTYYVAIHDFAGGSENRKLYFELIEKHALLGHSPEHSSNCDLLFMTVRGNGFNELKRLSLKGCGTELAPVQIAVIDKYNLKAAFELDKTPLPTGSYHLEAVFDDEGTERLVVCTTTMYMEERREGEITVSILPSSVAGTPYKVYVTVTNTGNDGVWGVPFNFAFNDAGKDCYVEGLNFGLSDRTGNSSEQPTIHIDDLLGTGQPGTYTPTYIPYMAPHESQTFELGFTTPPHEQVSMRAWAGEAWSREARQMQQPGYTLPAQRGGNYMSMAELTMMLLEDTHSVTGMDFNSPADAVDMAIMVGKYACLAGEEEARYILNQQLRNLDYYKQSIDDDMYESIGLGSQERIAKGMLLVADDLREAFSALTGIDGIPEFIRGLIRARQRWHAVYSAEHPPVHKIDSKQSGDPNEMHGYRSPSGDAYIGNSVSTIPYDIEFENDPEIATAAATLIRVENIIPEEKLDLASFRPTKMIIGKKEMELPAEHHFVRTLDMRPEINAIAELTFDYEASSGKAIWNIQTLDPMTMEPTRYFEDGILPVNDDTGRGTGHLLYTIDLKEGLEDGTVIENSAVIIFDDNAPIQTPTCINTLDYNVPVANILSAEASEDKLSYTVTVEGEDSGSGIWYYNLYARSSGEDKWTLVRSESMSETIVYESATPLTATVFAVVAVDRAGNRGDESAINGIIGDADSNGKVDAGDAVVIRNYFTGKTDSINKINAEVTADGKIDAQDATIVRNLFLDKKTRSQKLQRKKR